MFNYCTRGLSILAHVGNDGQVIAGALTIYYTRYLSAKSIFLLHNRPSHLGPGGQP